MHWQLDVTFKEDQNHTLDKTAAENQNIIRKWCLTALKQAVFMNGKVKSMRQKRMIVSFSEKWNGKYPNILKSWDKNWAELTTFFEYPQEIRRIIYTTNAVEGYHRMVRKFTKSKSIFPTDDSIRKVIYLSASEISKKWNMPVRDWGLAYPQFMIYFEDRFAA